LRWAEAVVSSENSVSSAARRIAVALALTMSVIGCAQREASVSRGPHVTDATITAKVEAEISQDPALKAMEIEVRTDRGTVELSGFVTTPDMIVRASEIARHVSGVQAVQNNLMVK
jgi:osmotically-inducible protein OsmY